MLGILISKEGRFDDFPYIVNLYIVLILPNQQ